MQNDSQFTKVDKSLPKKLRNYFRHLRF